MSPTVSTFLTPIRRGLVHASQAVGRGVGQCVRTASALTNRLRNR